MSGDERDAIERELHAIYDTEPDERDYADDLRADDLRDQLADWATLRNECQQVGCRQDTEGWAYCAEHRLPGMSGHGEA